MVDIERDEKLRFSSGEKVVVLVYMLGLFYVIVHMEAVRHCFAFNKEKGDTLCIVGHVFHNRSICETRCVHIQNV
jgi:hypothetical protein